MTDQILFHGAIENKWIPKMRFRVFGVPDDSSQVRIEIYLIWNKEREPEIQILDSRIMPREQITEFLVRAGQKDMGDYL